MSDLDRDTYLDGAIDAYAYIKYIPQLPPTIRKTMFGNADTIEEVLAHYDVKEVMGKIREYLKWEHRPHTD